MTLIALKGCFNTASVLKRCLIASNNSDGVFLTEKRSDLSVIIVFVFVSKTQKECPLKLI